MPRVSCAIAGLRGRLIIAAVIDEEYASLGADALVKEWRADAAVVTEPTDLQIGVGHKGFAWFELETRGRAAHGSRPRDGRDAIMRMGRVLHAARGARSRAAVPRGPPGTRHARHCMRRSSTADASGAVYPDRCELRVERRTIAGETAASAEAEIRAADLSH